MLPQASIEHMWGLQKSMQVYALRRGSAGGGAPASMAKTTGSVDAAGRGLGATEAGSAAAGQCKEAMPCQ
jgi:hypothetical protein